MDHFELVSEYAPTGDQPQAIEQLVKGFQEGNQCQTLLGVTGSGKTFTMANVIAQLNKPTLIIAHNKTLAAQLYGEFKEFFPNNAVEYFVSSITTTTSRRLTFHPLTRTSRRIRLLMMRLTSCAYQQPRLLLSGVMLLSSPAYLAFMGWVSRKTLRR